MIPLSTPLTMSLVAALSCGVVPDGRVVLQAKQVSSTSAIAAAQRGEYDDNLKILNAFGITMPDVRPGWMGGSKREFLTNMSEIMKKGFYFLEKPVWNVPPQPQRFPYSLPEITRALLLTPDSAPGGVLDTHKRLVELAKADRAHNQAQDEKEIQLTARRKALIPLIGWEAPGVNFDDLMRLNMYEFIHKMHEYAMYRVVPFPLPTLKDEAARAVKLGSDGLPDKQKMEEFILHHAERAYYADRDEASKPKPEEIWRIERPSVISKALPICLVPASEGPKWAQQKADIDVLLALREKCVSLGEVAYLKRTRVLEALDAAIFNVDTDARQSFLRTGIHDAYAKDVIAQIAAMEYANVLAVSGIIEPERKIGVRLRLVVEGEKAIKAGPDAVRAFLKRYRENDPELFFQSFRATSPGVGGSFLIHTDGGEALLSGKIVGNTDDVKRLPQANWILRSPLTAEAKARHCYSLESPDKPSMPGYFLRLREDRSVGVDRNEMTPEFYAEATWCAKSTPAGVVFTSSSAPNVKLRHWMSRMWGATQGGTKPFDSASMLEQDTTWRVEDKDPLAPSPIMDEWLNSPQLQTDLGQPNPAGETISGNVRIRDFANGTAYWAPTGQGVYALRWIPKSMMEKYLRLGGHKWLIPTALPQRDPAVVSPETGEGYSGGTVVTFPHMRNIYHTDQYGTVHIGGGIEIAWRTRPEWKPRLGAPIGDEVASTIGAVAPFERGWIEWDKESQKLFFLSRPKAIPTAFTNSVEAWMGEHPEMTPNGPVTQAKGNGGPPAGRDVYIQEFDQGRYYWTGQWGGVFMPHDRLWRRFIAQGGFEDRIPKETRATADGAGTLVAFEYKGPLRYLMSHAENVYEFGGGIAIKYFELGGETGRLGYPTSDERVEQPGKWRMDFERGWISFTAAGAEVHYTK